MKYYKIKIRKASIQLLFVMWFRWNFILLLNTKSIKNTLKWKFGWIIERK